MTLRIRYEIFHIKGNRYLSSIHITRGDISSNLLHKKLFNFISPVESIVKNTQFAPKHVDICYCK